MNRPTKDYTSKVAWLAVDPQPSLVVKNTTIYMGNGTITDLRYGGKAIIIPGKPVSRNNWIYYLSQIVILI